MYRLIIACLCLFWCVSCTTAQDTPPTNDHPLVTMLRRTPLRFADGELYYLDFRAVEDALPYVDRPQAGQIFYNDWTRYTQRWVSAPRILDGILRVADTYMVTMGFELRDVNRLFTFGAPPDTATIWSEEFDEEAIRNAHLARGFSAVTVQDVEAWCYSGDCSTGAQTNPREREDGNLFDNNLGRKVPFLMWDDLLISAPQQATLEASANVADNLYDNPDIRALAQASTATELEARVTTFSDYMNRRSTEPVWSTISGFSISQSVYKSDTERYVAVIRMAYDTPTEEQAFASIGSGNAVFPDARVFQRIWQAFLMRGFYPLWTGLGE